ncbi:MAG: TetR/AcrR family transcriptional regulator [Acholeplasmataceae bacterium]
MTTKELIYKNAVLLFKKEGFQNVGMRELAKSVGIKASSIYNHYKSKDEILFDILSTLINKIKEEIYPLFKESYSNPKEFLINTSIKTNNFFERPEIFTLTKIIIPEQFNNPKLKESLLLEFIVKPRGAYTYYFKSLMNKGLMTKTDPNLAAKMYHSFFVYHFYEMNLSNDNETYFTNHKDLFINHIELFIDYFTIK